MQEKSDEELVSEIQTGNVLAFEALVKRYQNRLVGFIYRLTKDYPLSEEIVQDALFSIYKSIDRIDTKQKFSTYLFVVAKNTAISRLRSQKKTISLTEITLAETDEIIYEKLTHNETKETIQRALSSLTSQQREVIKLYYFADLAYEEISQRLKLPLNTVRTHLRRGRESLKKILNYEND